MENRLDLLKVTLWFGNDSTTKVLITPEEWDRLFELGRAWIDCTNNERAITVS